jgi:hypothetical protein
MMAQGFHRPVTESRQAHEMSRTPRNTPVTIRVLFPVFLNFQAVRYSGHGVFAPESAFNWKRA